MEIMVHGIVSRILNGYVRVTISGNPSETNDADLVPFWMTKVTHAGRYVHEPLSDATSLSA